MADRCLARVPSLAGRAHASTDVSAPALTTGRGGAGSTAAASSDNEAWLTPWARGGSTSIGVGGVDFEAARAAAIEAEENYSRAGNLEGALTARRTEMSLRGDEAMVATAPLLPKRYRQRCIRV